MGGAFFRVHTRPYHPPTGITSNMSKLQADALRETITKIKSDAAEKKRKFVESIELQIVLKNYDTQKDKRFAGSIKLPNIPRERLSCCVLGDAFHIDQAKANGIDCMDVEALKALNKDKKKVKKLANKYNFFLASGTIMKQIPRLWDLPCTSSASSPHSLSVLRTWWIRSMASSQRSSSS